MNPASTCSALVVSPPLGSGAEIGRQDSTCGSACMRSSASATRCSSARRTSTSASSASRSPLCTYSRSRASSVDSASVSAVDEGSARELHRATDMAQEFEHMVS